MQKHLFYPAVFQEEPEGGYTITFPDLDGAVTYGEDMEEAYKMAVEVMGLTLECLEQEKKPIPEASKPRDIKLNSNQFVAVVEFDLFEYKKKHGSKAVSKNCTIPEWMNALVLENNLNCSQLLQEKIKEVSRL